jgi:dephospho-CoA kinase
VSPLLVEAKQAVFCDRILVVDVAEDVQLQRTIMRDNNDAEQVRRIIASQASRAQRLSHADDIIENTGSLEQLREQVKHLHGDYLKLARNKLV